MYLKSFHSLLSFSQKHEGLPGGLNILWHCLSLRLEWKVTFSSLVATAVFQICWHIECSTVTVSSFRIWNTCLLRHLYLSQEATVRTLYGTTDWFRIEKGIQQGCLLSTYVFNLYTENIIRNTVLDELQAGIKIGWRNTNNLRYVDDTTLMADSEEEIRVSWWGWRRVKEQA